MNRESIYKYWNKTELGIKMIKSNNVSDSDLLFLIPNNIKKRNGLPLTRIIGKKKSKQKKQRKRHIMGFRCFDLIEEMVNEHLSSAICNEEFFTKFVEVKNLNIGDRNTYELSTVKI